MSTQLTKYLPKKQGITTIIKHAKHKVLFFSHHLQSIRFSLKTYT